MKKYPNYCHCHIPANQGPKFQLMLLGSKFELYCSLNIRRLDQCFFYNAITSYFGYPFALITMFNIYRMFYIISVLAAARDVDHAAPG